jgi:sec-independent protein translocase protein TatA
MGLGGISLWQLLIVLLIVVVIFGTKKLGSIGGDLGGAVKGFRKAMGDADSDVQAGESAESKKLDEPDAEFSEQHTENHQTDRNHTS